MAEQLRFAVFPFFGRARPKFTYLTRQHVEDITRRAATYLDNQSGGRFTLQFRVFDYHKLEIDNPEGHGTELGLVARPQWERQFGINLDDFTHLVLITDSEISGLGQAKEHEGRPDEIYLGAKDLDPSIFAHELGHVLGTGHARTDAALGLEEYGDRFCVMGAENVSGSAAGKFDFPAVDLDARNGLGQAGWRFCEKCFGLFFDGFPINKGSCPAGVPASGHRARSGDPDVMLRHDTAVGADQAGWRRCTRCLGLFHQPGAALSVCPAVSPAGGPAVGPHVELTPGFDHVLSVHVPLAPGQPHWSLCRKCGGLFYARFTEGGRCPVGTDHEASEGAANFALRHDVRSHNDCPPGMVATNLIECGWLKPDQHGVDAGESLRARPGEVEVRIERLRGAPRDGEAGGPVIAFADGVADRRLVIEFRARDGDWDRALPATTAGSAAWVLVHLPHSSRGSQRIAAVPAIPGVTSFLLDANATMSVRGVDPAGAVTLRLRSEAAPGFGPLDRKTTLGEHSGHAPSLATDGRRMLLAWTGTDNRINVLASDDYGVTFGAKLVSVERSLHAPCVTGSGHIAWTGDDGRLNVALIVTGPAAPDVTGLAGKVTLSEFSNVRPALTHDPSGTLYLAWTGGARALNLVTSLDGGATWGPKHTFAETSGAGPALHSHAGGRLYMAWKGADNDRLNVGRVDLEWNYSPSPAVLGVSGRGESPGLVFKETLPEITPVTGPALTSFGGSLFLGWTDGARRLNVAGPVGGPSGYRKQVITSEQSDRGPGLASHPDGLVLAWRGAENARLNTARVASARRVLDDFRSGPLAVTIRSPGHRSDIQPGAMVTGARRVRLTCAALPSPAVVRDTNLRIADGRLELIQEPDQPVVLTVGYGIEPGGTELLDLREGGADRFRITITELLAEVVHLSVVTFTRTGQVAFNGIFTSGPADVRFADFGSDADFSAVSFVHFVLEPHGVQPAGGRPTLLLGGIDVRGPADA